MFPALLANLPALTLGLAGGTAHTTAANGAAASPDQPAIVVLLVMLLCAALMAILGKRFRLPTIASYLIAGALLAVTGLINAHTPNVESISELALVMLMFTVGLHLDPSELSRGMVSVLLVGVLATIASVGAILPLTVGISATAPLPTGLALAMGFSMSSTAVVVRIMQQRRDTQRTHGRIILGSLIVQDLIALVFLAMMPALALWAGAKSIETAGNGSGFLLPLGWHWSLRAVVAITGITLMILLARKLLPWLLHHAARGKNSEIPLVTAAAAGLTCAGLAFGLGFSAELGAFLAGFILAGTDFRHHLAGQLVPMRDLFMAVFFTSVGLQINPATLGANWPILLIGVVGVLSLKAVAIGAVVWLSGATTVVSVVTGLALCQAGEFSIVLIHEAVRLGLLNQTQSGVSISIVGITLLLAPALYHLGFRLGPWANTIPPAGWKRFRLLNDIAPDKSVHAGKPHPPVHAENAQSNEPALASYVIIAGFGVVGRSLADRLDVSDVPYCIVDMNQATINTQRRLGRHAIYGDVSNAEVLESAGIERADAVMLTIPDDEATLRACQVVREHRPDVYIAARTSFLSKAMQAMQLGADMVVVEEVATAEAMAKQVMEGLRHRAKSRPHPTTPPVTHPSS